MRSAQLTERDLVVLRALALMVRLFGLRQLAEVLWNGDVANARRRLRQLTALGLLRRHVVLARPLPQILGPVFTWQPGQADPDAGHLSFRLRSRWRYRALRTTVCFLPTDKCVDHFGGRSKTLISTQVSHDLGVAEVWLWYWRTVPEYLAQWRGEDQIADSEYGQSLPDAVLVDENDEPHMLIEFGGDYSAARIAAFHDDAAARGLPYQLW